MLAIYVTYGMVSGMSNVHVAINTIEATAPELREIAGVDAQFYHPFSRYVQRPFQRDSPEIPATRLLRDEQTEILNRFTGVRHDHLAHHSYFRDQWPGTQHNVQGFVSELPIDEFFPDPSRYALLVHRLDFDGTGLLYLTQEVVLQTYEQDTEAWQTVAGVCVYAQADKQQGFVDPEVLPLVGGEPASFVKEITKQYLMNTVATVIEDLFVTDDEF